MSYFQVKKKKVLVKLGTKETDERNTKMVMMEGWFSLTSMNCSFHG